MVWTEFPDRGDPVITQLSAEVPVGDNRDVVDMDVTVDICQVVPDVIDSRAVVAMLRMDSRIGEFSVLSLGGCDPSIDMDTLEGDELVICSRNVGISDGDEEWLCLLYSASLGSVWDNSVAAGLYCKGLDHWRGIVWDPGIVGKRCLHVCYDCLCLDRFVS